MLTDRIRVIAWPSVIRKNAISGTFDSSSQSCLAVSSDFLEKGSLDGGEVFNPGGNEPSEADDQLEISDQTA